MPNFSKMGEKAYRDAPGLNKSLLVPFMRSPLHYLHELNNPKKATASMNLGTALHAELLRPLEATTVYATCRKVDRRKTADKEYLAEFEAENAGKVIIDEEQQAALYGMKDAVMAHPAARRLIEQAEYKEQPLFATYTASTLDHKVKLKAMADGFSIPEGFMLDVKTSESAAPSEFAKKVRAFRYDIQQVHYQYIATANGIDVKQFPFIVIENEAPFGVAVYTLDPERIKRTWDEWKSAMEFYCLCEQKQDFSSGYPDAISELSF